MTDKLDESEVGRILDSLCLQGNGEEVSIWCWLHVCCDCSYRNKDEKEGKV